MKKFKFVLLILLILFFCGSSFADDYTETITTENWAPGNMYFDASSFMPTYGSLPMATLLSYPSFGIPSGWYDKVVIKENLFHDGHHLTYSLLFVTSGNPTLHVQENVTYDDNDGSIIAADCNVDNSSYFCIGNEILGNLSFEVKHLISNHTE